MTGDERAAVARRVAGASASAPVVLLGRGQENVAFLVDGRLVARFAVAPGADVEREAELLAIVAAVSPLPVPQPVAVSPADRCLVYERLPGVPLLSIEPERREQAPVAAGLGALLRALHDLPLARVEALVGIDDDPPQTWLDEARALYDATTASALTTAQRRDVEAFLDLPPPPAHGGGGERVFSHNDLGIEHVLVDPATLAPTGVIDWSDAALVDPAYDFGLLLRDLGPRALDAALAAYGREPPGLRERATFYARCSLLEDLAYGLAQGLPEYVDKSLAATWIYRTATER